MKETMPDSSSVPEKAAGAFFAPGWKPLRTARGIPSRAAPLKGQ